MRTTIRDIEVADVEADEMWGFVGMKEKTRVQNNAGEEFGDTWCFVGIERNTKLILAYHVGKRTPNDAYYFTRKLKKATTGRFQLSTDGLGTYRHTMRQFEPQGVDFAQLVKIYGPSPNTTTTRYSPAEIKSIKKEKQFGNPDMDRVCTSFIERANLSIRMHVRRLTRLTNAHSKKWENHEAAMALFFAWYNFCRKHQTLKTTPAVAAGITDKPWTMERLLSESARFSNAA